MGIGAAPNLSGGLWLEGMSGSQLDMGNGNANTGEKSPTMGFGADPATTDCGITGGSCTCIICMLNGVPCSNLCGIPVGPTPPPVQLSGPHTAGLIVMGNVTGANLSGVMVTCMEIGVTLPTSCSGSVNVFFDVQNPGNYHLVCLPGPAEDCGAKQIYNYGGGEQTCIADFSCEITLSRA